MDTTESKTLMTSGPIWKKIIMFALPLFLGNLFQQLYNTADSLIVGNFLDSNALAAVSSSGNLIFLMVGFFNGIAMGAGVVIARYYGAGNRDSLQKAIHTTIALGLAASAVLTLAGVILAPQILVWMGTPKDVLPQSITYFRIYFAGSLGFVMYNVFVGILQSVGDSRHPLVYLIIHNGLPAGFQNSIIAFANVIVQTNINAFGKMAVAGCGAYSKIEGFVFLPINCFTLALTTFVSQNLGAREYDRAKKGAKFGLVCSMLIAEVIGVLIYTFAPFLIAAFNNEAHVIQFGTAQARTVTLFYFLLALSHCIAAILRGSGKASVPMLVMLVFWCIVRVSYISVIVKFVPDIQVIFWAYPLTWFLSSVVFVLYYKKADWVHGFERV